MRSSPILLLLSILVTAQAFGSPEPVDFNRDIRPIFNNHCVGCHGGVKRNAGLNLVFRSEALKPAKSGRRPLVPGEPSKSELLTRVSHADADERMPPKKEALAAGDIKNIERWIAA